MTNNSKCSKKYYDDGLENIFDYTWSMCICEYGESIPLTSTYSGIVGIWK